MAVAPAPGAAGGSVPNWMPQPVDPSTLQDCPAGLEYLSMLDQVLAHQVTELLEAFTGWESSNKYVIKNSVGQQCYYAFEDSNICCRLCCGTRRGFNMHIVDNMQKEVMLVRREFQCCAQSGWLAGCCHCCGHSIVVEAPPGVRIGAVRQACGWCSLNMNVYDQTDKLRAYIDGPCCTCKCCCDVDYPILTADKVLKIGCISKQFAGAVSEYFTDKDNFGLSFPKTMDVRLKATLIGAMFLIDFLEFEDNSKSNDQRSPSMF